MKCLRKTWSRFSEATKKRVNTSTGTVAPASPPLALETNPGCQKYMLESYMARHVELWMPQDCDMLLQVTEIFGQLRYVS
jgi:hypothetical protein